MNLHFSISLKLTIIVVAVSASVIFSLTLYNINEQAISFENIYVDKAKDTGRLFDIMFSLSKDDVKIQQFLEEINQSKEINRIDIYFTKKNTTQLFYSTIDRAIDPISYEYVNLSIETNKQVKIPQYSDNHYNLTIITSMNTSNNYTGAYAIHFSIDKSFKAFETKTSNLLLISIISLFILIFAFLFFLHHTIVKPITHFRDTAKTFGKGNLDMRISISSNDEIGELANAFNTMAKDLKLSRNKIEEYNKILERLLNQKDEFIGQLGHDLKNPLQSIVGLLPLLLEKEENPKMKEHLDVLNTDAQYMKELILKTLELAKLRSENIEFDYSHVNINELVKKSIRSQNLFFKKHHITIENVLSDDIWVYADMLRLEEVIKNLLTNAIKYTPESGGKIRISAEQEKDKITISIKD